MHISVQGGDIPAPITTFEEMPFRKDQGALKHTILHNIEGFGTFICIVCVVRHFKLVCRVQGAHPHPDAVDSYRDE